MRASELRRKSEVEGMKVLSLVPGLDPARGGIASAATSMLLAARKVGVDSVVAVPQHGRLMTEAPSRVLIDLLERSGVVVKSLPALSWPRAAAYRWGISPAQARWTARHIADFDLVHVHGVWGMSPVIGLAAGRLAGKPIVVTAHESLTTFDIDGSRSASRRRQKQLLKSLYLRYATLFVLGSELESQASLPPSAHQRIVYLPLVDADGEVPALRPHREKRDLRVGFLGRVDPKKNLDLLIDATARLPDHVHLVIAGDGPADLVNSLRRRADDLGTGDRVEWLGFIEPGDRTRFLEDLDLLAMPSSFESFGLSAAEAMLHGVPVLVSERTGIAEVISRHGGGTITRVTVPAIARAISDLDADRGALTAIGSCGQAAVREELNYTRIGQSLREAYTDAIRLHKTQHAR